MSRGFLERHAADVEKEFRIQIRLLRDRTILACRIHNTETNPRPRLFPLSVNRQLSNWTDARIHQHQVGVIPPQRANVHAVYMPSVSGADTMGNVQRHPRWAHSLGISSHGWMDIELKFISQLLTAYLAGLLLAAPP